MTGLTRMQGVVVLLVGALTILPFVPLVIQSLAFRWAWPDLLPGTWWWERREASPIPLGWDYVLSSHSRLWEAARNTVWIGAAVAVAATAICLPAARLLARRRFRGKGAVELGLALPLVVPEAAIGLALAVAFIQIGLAGTTAGVIVVHLIPTVPYVTRLLTAVWQNHGTDAEEQAALLGASPSTILRRVTLPMLLPGVLAGMLFAFLVSSNVFLLTFLVGRGEVLTLPTLLFASIRGGALDAVGAGLALAATVPGLALLAMSERMLLGAAPR